MQATFPLAHRTDLEQIATLVFQTMLNLEIAPAGIASPSAADTLTAAIYFAGEWKGALLLECTKSQAFEFTHRLMSIDLPASINDDVRDTMGELTNMLAGNLKSVLPPNVGLSMPSVVEGTDYSLRLCGGNLADRVSFTSAVGVISVTMIEMVER
jgi:chemotaxis protein CheX